MYMHKSIKGVIIYIHSDAVEYISLSDTLHTHASSHRAPPPCRRLGRENTHYDDKM